MKQRSVKCGGGAGIREGRLVVGDDEAIVQMRDPPVIGGGLAAFLYTYILYIVILFLILGQRRQVPSLIHVTDLFCPTC